MIISRSLGCVLGKLTFLWIDKRLLRGHRGTPSPVTSSFCSTQAYYIAWEEGKKWILAMQSSKITDLDQLLYFIGKKLNFRNIQCNFKLTLLARAKLRLELLQAKSLADPFPGHLCCSMAKLHYFPSFMITLTRIYLYIV